MAIDLIPWALIYFDQAISSLSSKTGNYNNLESKSKQLDSWFVYYSTRYDPITAEMYDTGDDDDTNDLFDAWNPLHNNMNESKSPNQSQGWLSPIRKALTKEELYGETQDISPYISASEQQLFDLKPTNLNNNKKYRIKSFVFGLSYKVISKFAHDFGIIPYLLKEPELFRYIL